MTHTLPADRVRYLVGGSQVEASPLIPYHPLVIEFLEELSGVLRRDTKTKEFPDVMTFAFWCRKANIEKLKADFQNEDVRLGRGYAFHIAPANVPVNFAFSFVFGLLSGNANVVRLPSKDFPQSEIICSAINKIFEDEKFSEIKKMTAFVQFDSHSDLAEKFSADCQARVVWGGNQTVKTIRALPASERSVDVVFPDRYSFCVLNAEAVLVLDEDGIQRLAQDFFNDTYLMDQNACSSPHLIVWTGTEVERAQDKFWSEVSKVAEQKYPIQSAQAVHKYAQMCGDAIRLDGDLKKTGVNVHRALLKTLPENLDSLRGRYGYFYEYQSKDLSELAKIVTEKYQTLTFFGVPKQKLVEFVVSNRLAGIDRIVPVGRALDIGVIWDGYDVIRTLSRVIEVPK